MNHLVSSHSQTTKLEKNRQADRQLSLFNICHMLIYVIYSPVIGCVPQDNETVMGGPLLGGVPADLVEPVADVHLWCYEWCWIGEGWMDELVVLGWRE